MFERKIKDKRFINFLKQLIDPNELPIGCYYSQWFSNFFLTDFDHYIKEVCRCPFYIRYVDDMVLGGNNKKKLKGVYIKAKHYIFDLGIEFKYKPIARPFTNFLGFIYKNGIVKLRHNIFYRLQHTIKNMKKHICFSLCKRLISYFSWLKNMDSGYGYYKYNIFPIIKLGRLKIIMSKGGI